MKVCESWVGVYCDYCSKPGMKPVRLKARWEPSAEHGKTQVRIECPHCKRMSRWSVNLKDALQDFRRTDDDKS